MCTLAVYFRVSPAYPLVVAANRDEFFGRPALAPAPVPERPSIVAGRDLQAGGTWLGARIDGAGRVAGVLNRRPAADRPGSGPGELSRGLLCLETLEAASIGAAIDALDASKAARYGGFNLFVAEPGRAAVVDNGAGVRTTELSAGLSVLTNLDLNDPRCPRLAGATTLFAALQPRVAAGEGPEELLADLTCVLGDHSRGGEVDGDSPLSRICVHTPAYGTRSSSVLFVSGDGAVRYFHADGPPCQTGFEEICWPR